MNRKNARGFSIIEMILVISIMAALIGVLVPVFFTNDEAAESVRDNANMEMISKAISNYMLDYGSPFYGPAKKPITSEKLVEMGYLTGSVSIADHDRRYVIKVTPNDPAAWNFFLNFARTDRAYLNESILAAPPGSGCSVEVIKEVREKVDQYDEDTGDYEGWSWEYLPQKSKKVFTLGDTSGG